MHLSLFLNIKNKKLIIQYSSKSKTYFSQQRYFFLVAHVQKRRLFPQRDKISPSMRSTVHMYVDDNSSMKKVHENLN